MCFLVLMVSGCSPVGVGPPQHADVPGGRLALVLSSAHDAGPISLSRRVTVLVTLRDSNETRLRRDVAHLASNPSAGFLTVARVDALYGPPVAEVTAARQYLERRGVSTDWTQGNNWLLATGPAGRIERAFDVHIHQYSFPSGETFYASPTPAAVPTALQFVVAGIGQISSFDRRQPLRPEHLHEVLAPTDLMAAYNLTPLSRAGMNGSGLTVAFIEADGFKQSDLDAFARKFHLPSFKPTIKYGSALRDVEGEAEMDLEIVHAIAPAARITVYNCPGQCGTNEMLKAEDQAVRGTPGGIISISLGGCEQDEGKTGLQAESSIYSRADALGESVFVASGDSGAYTCLTRDWGAPPAPRFIGVSSPASIPGVTAVGGTRLYVNQNGSWRSEVVWESPLQTAGSGGGTSSFFVRPSWQKVSSVTLNRRGVPDVAADADPDTSPVVQISGQATSGGGTSEAAPIWAGMTALIDQYLRKQKLRTAGFVNPALYALASGHPAYPPFHDVTVGGNLVNRAKSGYDLAAGLGTPNGWNLARDLVFYIKGTSP